MRRNYPAVALVLSVSAVIIGLLSGCRAKERQEINVLCSLGETFCQGAKEAFSSKFGITVNYVRMSTGEALARLQQEKEQPQFDLWWGGPIDSYILATEQGVLEAYDSPNYANLQDQKNFKSPQNYWAGIYVSSVGFGTNTNWLAAHPGVEPPSSWDDLLKPEFANQIIVAHPSTSGTSYTILATIFQIKGEAAGWEYLKKLSNQIFQLTKSGSSPIEIVGAGEAAVSLAFSPSIIRRIKEDNLPLVLTFPKDGTGYEIGGMAIVKGAKHLDAAKKWFDWYLTPEAQALAPQFDAFQAPTVKGVQYLYPELFEVNLIHYDFNWAAEHKTDIIEKFTQDIAGADNLRE